MTTRTAVEDFLSQKSLAVVGVSRSGKKFGNSAFKELKTKGYKVYPVNPNAENIDGDACYPNLASLPETVDGILVVVPPSQTEAIVREAADAGINRVWMQQGAESDYAVRFCAEHGMIAVHGECILMFAEPAAWFHRMHRGVWRILGKLPN